MQYHIQTNPIWDAFKSECECPMCEIYDKVNNRLVNQYLDEAVMEPAYRVKVNKFGFCSKHFVDLFDGKNKLGLGLQIHTRTEYVLQNLKKIENIKQAKKQIESIEHSLNTCVICESADEMMTRYAYTIAQMYLAEQDFPKLLTSSKGFCMPHYCLILKNASHSGAKINEYLNVLSALQMEQLTRLNRETEWFTLKFDYRNKEKSWGTSKDAVPRGINKLRGKIVKPINDNTSK